MSPNLHRGQLFVFEGIDRCGKSTQCETLKLALENVGRNVVLYNFPKRDTAIGSVIDKYLKKEINLPDQSIHLLFSANRWECMCEIQAMLADGTTIIMDRYAYSGIAYSVAKRTLSLPWCIGPDKGIIKPDCIFFLHMNPSEAKNRSGFGNERYEVQEFQAKVCNEFMKLKDNSWKVIDAEKPMEMISAEVFEHALQVNNKELKRLWIDDSYEPCVICPKT